MAPIKHNSIIIEPLSFNRGAQFYYKSINQFLYNSLQDFHSFSYYLAEKEEIIKSN